MKISGFHKHIFWSYTENADLPEKLIAHQVILFGEIGDMILLTKKLNRELIEQVADSLNGNHRNKKRIHFFKKVILD